MMSRHRQIFEKYQIKPLKRLGQNFLVDKFAVKKVVEAGTLKPDDIILEIGPGTGILTRELAKRVKKVIAVEKDQRMISVLWDTLRAFDNVEVVQEDILKMQNAKVPQKARLAQGGKNQNDNSKAEVWQSQTRRSQRAKLSSRPFGSERMAKPSVSFKIIGNLPFYLTAPVIRKFLEAEVKPELMVFIVQKEVAQRICAKPPRPNRARLVPQRGAAKMNLLAVSVQFYAAPKIVSYVPKTSFWPKPKVDSAIIKITPHTNKYAYVQTLVQRFFSIVKAGFSHPRKQLVNNLSRVLKLNKEKTAAWLSRNGIKPEQRAETLTIENWIALAKSRIIK